jgi:hypothetical protein
MGTALFETRAPGILLAGGEQNFSGEIARSRHSLGTPILVGSSFLGEDRQGSDAAKTLMQT